MEELKNKNSGIIKKQYLNLKNEPVLIDPHHKTSSVRVNLKKEGDIVRIIQVICSCGNKIDILCEYENEDLTHL